MVLRDGETLADLRCRFPATGEVAWMGVRPQPRAPLEAVETAQLHAGRGIQGDHRAAARRDSTRQVTLLQGEHLETLASLLGRPVEPAMLRRNLVVRGINLLALKDMPFRLGTALLAGTGPCHPCSRMEQALGPGGYNAMRGHGGITAVVLEDGRVALGDRLAVMGPAT